ncbi:MAG: phenylalanine--tRNA ligase subunit beta [Phycisphaerae bacterium]|nr:phenylalanine--tRNA ligase subunit beta [Phycisphaerae bacterium]
MKISLDWIARYLDKSVATEEAREALLNAGLPVESVVDTQHGPLLDVEVTSNRSDCLCHLGMARELAALLDRKLLPPKVEVKESSRPVDQLIQVRIADTAGCMRYVARVISNVRIGPSPAWLQQALESVGQRSINNVVDVTNYVLLETGQPLHAFDLDQLQGRQIVVRRAKAGEKLMTIDGQTRALQPTMLVIADEESPVAVAGIMGGKDSGVTEATVNVLLESARFDPLTIRQTARALTLSSESSYRFERGIDPAATEWASVRAAQLILEVAGGDLARGVSAVGKVEDGCREVRLRPEQVKRIVGIEIPPEQIREILTRLEFSPRADGPDLVCRVPSHRLDVWREIDLIEEICRVWGYGRIPVERKVSHAVRLLDRTQEAGRVMRTTLAGAGASEAITFSFVDAVEAQLFLDPAAGEPLRVSDAVRKVSNTLRPSIFPGLLRSRRHNETNGQLNAFLFEVASIYFQRAGKAGEKPYEEPQLAMVGDTVAHLTGALELVVQKLNRRAVLQVHPRDCMPFARGAAGEVQVRVDGQGAALLGSVGVFGPMVQAHYDLKQTAAGLQVRWSALLDLFEPVPSARAIARFPAVRRDLSVVVDEGVRWGTLRDLLAELALEFIESVELVGVFRGKQVEAGRKSVTLTLVFRNPEATLRSHEVDLQIQRAVAGLQHRCGAVLRV